VGHLAVARAAERRFQLDEIHFIPSGRPPHKPKHLLAPFPHRYAMVALACANHPAFVPSLAEAGPDHTGRYIFYSIDTVGQFRRRIGPNDRLYFLMGADAFLQIRTWKEYEALLDACDFIVASRPGLRLRTLRRVIPRERLRHAEGRPGRNQGEDALETHAIPLRQSCVYLLETVASHVSSSEIRRRLHRRQSIRGLVPRRVEEYILNQALYR
jgi:nicotinate-nucleotide adenylyltransferase